MHAILFGTMAKDYFQDILPPEDDSPRPAPAAPAPEEHELDTPPTAIPVRKRNETLPEEEPTDAPHERSIRDISMPSRNRPRAPLPDMREPSPITGKPARRMSSRIWMWGIAGVAIVALGALIFVALRPTAVMVTPRSHEITFDSSILYTAYPIATAATGTLSYSIETIDVEDSAVVETSGTVHAEDKASGSITVYNNFQTSSFKLIKNTRFETPGGLIFRTPSEVVIPGKKGSTPGQVTITVFADEPGEKYNVPAGKFTVPGLKSSAAQYAGVYAESTAPMTGGFVGEKPGVAPGAKEAAISAVRTRLEGKVRDGLPSGDDKLVFPGLVRIEYQDLPDTVEAGGGLRIHQKAHAQVPVLPASAFASNVSADVANAPVRLVAGAGFSAQEINGPADFTSGPLQFSVSGVATIVWNVDTEELGKALAGKSEDAFQGIVAQFPGIEEAHARIEPFWKNDFPTDPTQIDIELEPLKS